MKKKCNRQGLASTQTELLRENPPLFIVVLFLFSSYQISVNIIQHAIITANQGSLFQKTELKTRNISSKQLLPNFELKPDFFD